MAQQFGTTFKRSSVTKMLAAEVTRTTHALPKGEEQYESQTYLSPTGRTVAKIMVAGVATEKEDIGKDQSLWRLRISDPSGAIGVMAGMYQPEAMQAIAQLEIPSYVAIVGKLNVYEPESGSHIVSIRPDSVTVIDAKSRDDLVLDAAISTTRSIKKTMADPETMKKVAEVYAGGHDQAAYVLVVQQALESLLPAPSTEKQEPAPKDQKPSAVVTKTNDNDKAGEDKPPTPTPAGKPKQPAKKETKEKPAEPPKTKEKEKPAKPSSPSPNPKVGSIENGIKTIQEVVLEVIKEKREVIYTDLPDMLRNKGVNPNMMDWESAVKRLLNEGLIHEPKLGKLKAV